MDSEKGRLLDRITGCLIGGGIGDALGAFTENLAPAAARTKFSMEPWQTGLLRVTSNTQLTLFTAEGLIRASQRYRSKGLCSIPNVLLYAYGRWMHTQGLPAHVSAAPGWLVECPQMKAQRGTCATLKAALTQGPSRKSKGNGAVTRVAPVGLTTLDARTVAAEVAAISHPHPEAQEAAGNLASIVQRVMEGGTLELAIRSSDPRLSKCYHGAAVSGPTPKMPTLTARQALEAAVSAVGSTYPRVDFWQSLEVAVCNGGAADAVGSLTGQLLGCTLGYSGLPMDLVERLELAPELRMLARDLWYEYRGRAWTELYPGN